MMAATLVWCLAAAVGASPGDPRDLRSGTVMLEAGYLDQPYCATLPRTGRWLCTQKKSAKTAKKSKTNREKSRGARRGTITMNSRPEGSPGEHVAALWSDDRGATWSSPVALEPAPLGLELANVPAKAAQQEEKKRVPGHCDKFAVIFAVEQAT